MTQLTGQQVVTDDVTGATSGSFKDLLLFGVRSAIDLEVAERTQLIGDRATVNSTGAATSPSQSARVGAAVDTVKALTPIQLGGIALALVGVWGLVTGKFRK